MPKHLGYYTKIISKQMENNKNNDIKEFGLTAQQFSILMYLNRTEKKDIYQKDIENYLNISAATASGILKRLENNGFITRKVCEHNSKYKVIRPTLKGQEFFDEINLRIENNEKNMLDGLSDSEIDLLMDILTRITKNIKKEK